MVQLLYLKLVVRNLRGNPVTSSHRNLYVWEGAYDLISCLG